MIKEISIQDEKQVYQLICELEQDTFNNEDFKRRFHQAIQSKQCLMFGYFKQDILIGVISLYIKEYLPHHHKTGEIAELIISSEERNKKIGKQLIQFVIQKGKELQLEELELCTNIKRINAHHFYQREGFVMDHYNFIKKL